MWHDSILVSKIRSLQQSQCDSFSILTRKALKTQAFTSVEHLTEVIDHWAVHWNHDPQPLKWTKTADQIIAKVKRARTALNKTATHH